MLCVVCGVCVCVCVCVCFVRGVCGVRGVRGVCEFFVCVVSVVTVARWCVSCVKWFVKVRKPRKIQRFPTKDVHRLETIFGETGVPRGDEISQDINPKDVQRCACTS